MHPVRLRVSMFSSALPTLHHDHTTVESASRLGSESGLHLVDGTEMSVLTGVAVVVGVLEKQFAIDEKRRDRRVFSSGDRFRPKNER